MPKNIKDNSKPKAGNAGGEAIKEKDDASKNDGKKKENNNNKPHRDNRSGMIRFIFLA